MGAARVVRVLVAAALAAGATACGGGSDGACGPILREALDSQYLVHVISGDAQVEYTSDPPTSGPHQPSPPVDGVLTEPIPRPVQVGILERGDILVQYQPDLDAADIEELATLAGPGVIVAPNPDLPDPVVATGWVHKRSCSSVDLPALQEFIDTRIGKVLGH